MFDLLKKLKRAQVDAEFYYDQWMKAIENLKKMRVERKELREQITQLTQERDEYRRLASSQRIKDLKAQIEAGEDRESTLEDQVAELEQKNAVLKQELAVISHRAVAAIS